MVASGLDPSARRGISRAMGKRKNRSRAMIIAAKRRSARPLALTGALGAEACRRRPREDSLRLGQRRRRRLLRRGPGVRSLLPLLILSSRGHTCHLHLYLPGASSSSRARTLRGSAGRLTRARSRTSRNTTADRTSYPTSPSGVRS